MQENSTYIECVEYTYNNMLVNFKRKNRRNETMNNFESVKGKVAVVTGATAGIGKAVAKVFADNGMKVVLTGRREELGQKIVDEIKAAGGEAVFCKSDVSKEEDVKKVMQYALDTYGQLNVLVNNAGAGTLLHPIHEYETEEFKRVTDVDYIGVFMAMKYGVKAMLSSKSEKCTIINISSASGMIANANYAPYCGAKRAVISLTQGCSLDYAKHGIRVNCICPGATDTDIYASLAPEQRELTQSMIPVGYFAKPEDIAYAALFLSSDMASYITGAIIPVDGAMSSGSYNEVLWTEQF